MLAQIALVLVGLWLMVAPQMLGYGGAAANSDRIAGPLITAFAFLAIFSITRGMRWLNLPLALWLLLGPLVFSFPLQAALSSMVAGILTLVLAGIGRPDQSQYGGGWIVLFQTSRLPWPDGE